MENLRARNGETCQHRACGKWPMQRTCAAQSRKFTLYGQMFAHHIGREFADVTICDDPPRFENREFLSDCPNKIEVLFDQEDGAVTFGRYALNDRSDSSTTDGCNPSVGSSMSRSLGPGPSPAQSRAAVADRRTGCRPLINNEFQGRKVIKHESRNLVPLRPLPSSAR